ncbi:MAG TPA: aminotransferase class I/II-fold pyridoxal phosphate-dependent enzyme, partial [Elusimicrobiota bacterium]|nr:aminotransferase class I/II-fold pyridoxal phosphate-dependent enzyme [Elusimicrobiota bacterium]
KAALAAPRGGAGAQQALSAAFDAAAADGSADAAPEPGAAPAPVANSRLSSLPPYIFVRREALKAQAPDAGHDVIDLGKGSPDLPAPDVAVEAVAKAVRDPKTHTYPPAAGTPELRAAIAEWYRGRFGVDVDVARGVLPLIGSKEGIAHTLLAILEPGDGVLMPTPGYPAYANQITLAGGRPIAMELREEDGFLPDFDRLEAALSEARARGRVRAMILNYPSNPTGAVVPDLAFLQRALDFAKRHDLIVLYDNAYAEISFDGHDSPTMLQVPGAKEARVIEFHTLSKGWSMAGFRLGFAVGDPEVIGALAKLKGFFDYGLPAFNQAAAVAALKDSGDYVARTRAIYQARRDVLVAALGAIGWEVRPPKGAMYVWARLPDAARGMSALEFVERLIREEGVLISPGSAFGPAGEGYVRISLIQPQERLVEAAARIARFLARLTP